MTPPAKRPDPEELLRRITAQETCDARGRLKIFLGYAPRVGKSLRMFDEGRRRKKRGQDVVIGIIQSRGKDEVADLLPEFEIIPSIIEREGEMIDVDAVRARAPQVCLVDELARDNPPCSRYAHRWEEVEALRACGINVIAAINLQHIAEQQDAVERISGRRSRSAVPQSFIQSADEIVIVDVPAQDLNQHALQQHGRPSSLSPEQLTELRELALLLAAEVVEEQLQRYMDSHGIHQSWGTQERILVCITPRSRAHAMLESGARAAARFHAQILAAYVQQHDLTREAQESVDDNLDYARKLGAEVHIIEGKSNDPIGEIVRFAHEQRVTQLFIGHTQQSSWKFWSSSPVDRLIQEADGMDVHIFPNARAQAA